MRREQRTTRKSNPIAGRPSPCSSQRTAATTTWADICLPRGQKAKFEIVGDRWCQNNRDRFQNIGGRRAFYWRQDRGKNTLVELSVAIPVRTMCSTRPPALVS